jgi:hypothetical protein
MAGNQTVDLSDQIPEVPRAQERAMILAKDLVAAADFFEFCVTLLFSHLLGWDYEKGKSTDQGGVLGKLQAFYGTTEFTEHSCLHGHFLIFLAGAPNPSELHE